MVRKRKTPLPPPNPPGDRSNGGSESRESVGAGRGGAQHPSSMQPNGGAHYSPDLQQCGEAAGRDRARANPQQQGGGGRGYPGGGGACPSATAETSRQPLTYLQQATQTPSQETSSSRPSDIPTEQLQQLSLQTEPAISQAVVPASSKQLMFPSRPGKGSLGSKCMVKANHFIAELSDNVFYQYDVSITPEVSSRMVNRSVINELVRTFKDSQLGRHLPAYDGRKNLYTAGSLPFSSKEFKITLLDEDRNAGPAGAPRRERIFKVVIKFAAQTDLCQLRMFLAGKQAEAPQEALQILDIVLRESPNARCYPVGRSFYSPDTCEERSLGEGLACWKGFYQSIRPTQMGLSLNIDISSTAFIEALPVVDFVKKLLNWNFRDRRPRKLTDAERATVNRSLKGVKVEVIHRKNTRRKYRIAGLTPQATKDLSFSVDGTMKTVVQYFQDAYEHLIQYPDWPCLQVGSEQRPNYLPMEVCQIVKGQRYSKRLNGDQVAAFIKATCQHPRDRERDIIRTVNRNQYHLDPYANEFGINIRRELASVEARVLPPPQLKYGETGTEKSCWPELGQWNMRNKKMVDGGKVRNWTCINFAQKEREKDIHWFCYELASSCCKSGMDFALNPVIEVSSAQPNQVESALKGLYNRAMTILRQQQHKELDLLIVILPDNNGSLYGNLKRICETEIGLVSQCCLIKNVIKQVYRKADQYFANVALKINVKVGGRNTKLADSMSKYFPLVSKEPTIIFGADVTHPQPGEDSSPSIAAVVASQDWPEITKYAGLVCAQAHRQELIEDLYKEPDPQRGNVSGGMIKDLLLSFRNATGKQPNRIIFYRDGVSEGQFYQVLLRELDSIRKACASLHPSYQPRVTFVVVQKRHHTRLFANNHGDTRSVDKSGNILPGTVVDSKICHPFGFDFYLCSHAGIQGTSRPAHYHVLWDENKFSADEMQMLTNSLCYTYARCTRSVSIVPPAYYAHLAASRARFYMEPMASENASQPRAAAGRAAAANEPRSTRVAGGGPVRPLPALKENVKRVMFYC